MNTSPENKKISKSRSKKWRGSLVSGKFEASQNPSQIRILRVQKRLSQHEIAKLLKLSPSTYLAIEVKKRLVTEDRAKAFSTLLKKPVKGLFKAASAGKFLAL